MNFLLNGAIRERNVVRVLRYRGSTRLTPGRIDLDVVCVDNEVSEWVLYPEDHQNTAFVPRFS